MNTEESLKEQFGSIHAKLVDVASVFLGLGEEAAKKQAAKGLIPFHIFKAGKSNKCPWLVDIRDLAVYLDEARRK